MNQSVIEKAFNEAVSDMKEDPKDFLVTYVAAMTSLLYLRACLEVIIDNPKNACEVAKHALQGMEEFSPTEIAKSLGMAAEGALN